MSAIPIRVRLTVAFSAALLVVLGFAAAFVLTRVGSDLTENADEALAARLDALATVAAGPGRGDPPVLRPVDPDEYEDNFSQVLKPDRALVASTLPADAGAALTPAEAAAAARGEVLIESRTLPGVDGDARVMARPTAGEGPKWVVVAGSSNQDREETLGRIAGAFAIGAPVALVIAALAGYALARRALRPVDRMRQQAELIEPGSSDRLSLPEANDELRRLGLTLNSMLGRQSEALERERAFVADASHELRTPLSVLRAELELTELEGGSPESLRSAIRAALGEVDRLARLSDDLLLIATADHGRIPIHRERVSGADLLERVADRLRRAANEQSRAIEVAHQGEAECFVDPLRVEQALGNLVDNALRYGAGTVSLRASSARGGLTVVVDDEGAGFPAEIAPHAFERLTRAPAARSTDGAGLGLSIVRAIAEAHGGEAVIEAGARVRLRFAAADRGQSSAPSRSTSP